MMSDHRAYLATLGLSSPMALEGFLEAAPDAIVVVDWSGHIVIVNQLAGRLFGYSRQELLGMPIEGLVPQRFRERHAGYRDDYFHEPHTRPMGEGRELWGRRKDGNLALDDNARRSARLDLAREDRADDDEFNRILWRAIKGDHTPYPGVRRAGVLEWARGR